MRFRKIKSDAKIDLKGFDIDREYTDGNLQVITFKHLESGHILQIRRTGWSEVDLYEPEPPKQVTVYVVTGKLSTGTEVNLEFDDENDANEAAGRIPGGAVATLLRLEDKKC